MSAKSGRQAPATFFLFHDALPKRHERTIPLPKDVKQAIDHYLKLDAGRRRHLHSDGDDAFIFQPIVNYRTLEFDKALSSRHIC